MTIFVSTETNLPLYVICVTFQQSDTLRHLEDRETNAAWLGAPQTGLVAVSAGVCHIFLPQRHSTSSPWHTHEPLTQGAIVPCVSQTQPRPVPGRCRDTAARLWTLLISFLFPPVCKSAWNEVFLCLKQDILKGGYWWHMHFQSLFAGVFLISESLYDTWEFDSKHR